MGDVLPIRVDVQNDYVFLDRHCRRLAYLGVLVGWGRGPGDETPRRRRSCGENRGIRVATVEQGVRVDLGIGVNDGSTAPGILNVLDTDRNLPPNNLWTSVPVSSPCLVA